MTAVTHDVTIGDTEVVKRYRQWAHGEPDVEWQALTLLAEHAPGLAPTPLRRETDGGAPVIVMSRQPGEPLGDRPLDGAQTAAVAELLDQLYAAVPASRLAALPCRRWSAPQAVRDLRERAAARPEGSGPAVRTALAAGERWINSADAGLLAGAAPARVFANADGNLANLLWDGTRCRIVDFEDAGASDRAYELADLVEHVNSRLAGTLDGDALLRLLALDAAQVRRLVQAQRLLALYWLHVLLPGGTAHRRNPEGSLERQAVRVLGLLG